MTHIWIIWFIFDCEFLHLNIKIKKTKSQNTTIFHKSKNIIWLIENQNYFSLFELKF